MGNGNQLSWLWKLYVVMSTAALVALAVLGGLAWTRIDSAESEVRRAHSEISVLASAIGDLERQHATTTRRLDDLDGTDGQQRSTILGLSDRVKDVESVLLLSTRAIDELVVCVNENNQFAALNGGRQTDPSDC